MIRLATIDDIPFLVDACLSLKQRTGWAKWDVPNERAGVVDFIASKLMDPRSLIVVRVEKGQITGFCAGSLGTLFLPPFLPYVAEWAWDGDKRSAVKCWHELCKWGRAKGAVVAGYVLAKPGKSNDTCSEQVVWRKL